VLVGEAKIQIFSLWFDISYCIEKWYSVCSWSKLVFRVSFFQVDLRFLVAKLTYPMSINHWLWWISVNILKLIFNKVALGRKNSQISVFPFNFIYITWGQFDLGRFDLGPIWLGADFVWGRFDLLPFKRANLDNPFEWFYELNILDTVVVTNSNFGTLIKLLNTPSCCWLETFALSIIAMFCFSLKRFLTVRSSFSRAQTYWISQKKITRDFIFSDTSKISKEKGYRTKF
jgi:hypothetical protein